MNYPLFCRPHACFFSLVILTGSLPEPCPAQYYTWSHFSGVTGSPGSGDSPGASARFYKPEGVAADNAGNLFVVDRSNHTIRKITPQGVVSTFAGLAGNPGNTNGPLASARFSNPHGIALDGNGTLYIAESLLIRKISPDGMVSTLAGGSYGSQDGTGTDARFADPTGITLDPATGNLYVTDASYHNIRRITPAGVTTTVAGQAGIRGTADGTGTAAAFDRPQGITMAGDGHLYVSDTNNNTIRKINPVTGAVTTYAGLAGTTGGSDDTGNLARFYAPIGIASAPGGVLYVVDGNNGMIRRISASAQVTTVAGQYLTEGTRDGLGREARFNNPYGIAPGPGGRLYVSDWENASIRIITPEGLVGTFAGFPGAEGSADSPTNTARFDSPRGLSLGLDGMLHLADFGNHTIRKVNPAGNTVTLAGSPGQTGSAEGLGNAARFFLPASTAVDSSGNTYIADYLNHTIRKATPAGMVSTLAGTAGSPGTADGTGSAARFTCPVAVAVDGAGSVYVADQNNHTIRKITAAGAVTTFAGLAGSQGTANGSGPAARFSSPSGVALDSAGNVYVTDYGSHTVRKITSAGLVSTLAGQPGSAGTADGTGSTARFSNPTSLAVDANGYVFVTDFGSHTVRRITPSGTVSTVGGLAGSGGYAPGTGSQARFLQPNGIAVDPLGNLYVGDANRHLVKGTLHATPWLAWLALHQITSGTDGDEDRDGVKNLLEFAFGTHPRIAENTPAAALTGGAVQRGLPALVPGQTAGTWRIVFAQRLDRLASQLTYLVEQSSNSSSTWSPVPGTADVVAQDSEIQILSLSLPAGPAPRFFRIRTTLPL